MVVALALAAVFGSMSLANPAFAQAAPTNVMAAVTTSDHDSDDATPEVPTTTSITVTWDDQDDAAEGNWQVQWRFASVADGWGTWRANGEGGVIITDDDTATDPAVTTVTAVIADAASGLNNGTGYCFRVRYIDGDLPGLASDEDCATPNAFPNGTIAAMAASKAETEDGDIVGGKITLTWTYTAGSNAAHITEWEYRARVSDTDDVTTGLQPQAWNRVDWMELEGVEETDVTDGFMATVDAPRDDVSYDYQVRPVAGDYKFVDTPLNDDVVGTEATTAAAIADPRSVIIPTVDPSFTAGSTSSYSNTSYKVQFQIWGEDDEGYRALNTLRDELVIEFHEDYTLPSSISTSAVTIDVEGADASGDPDAKTMLTFNPSDIVVDGEEAVFSLGDMNEDDDLSQYDLMPEAAITVNFRQAAGIRNPTEAGNYELVKIAFGDFEIEYDEKNMDHAGLLLEDGVRRKISLSEEDGGLGDMVTATAKGFENGVTLHFFLDKHLDANGKNVGPNGELDAGEDVLCSVLSVSGENVGTCDFEVTTPTFSTGYNFVNAVDGDGNGPYDPDNDDHRFELKASISASPAGGSPGEIMQVQMVSFPMGMAIQEIKLSGDYICGGVPPRMTETVNCSSYGTISSMGTASLAITVPNWAVAGKQELRIKAGGKTDTTNVTIVGPRIISTPSTVVANQRVSLVGTGFSPNSVLGDDTAAGAAVSRMSIGGHPIPWHKVNDGRDVNVDDGGNWASSVDLPLVEATTGSGDRTIRVTDSRGRSGSLSVSLAERSFDITPESGRVGTLAVVRGMGYPSKNDEGHSFTIDVIYKVQEGATARVSVVPDASGRFEVQLRIPTTASIPSTNQVEVSFDHEAGGTSVLENKQHMVPEGIIELSATSGGPGTTVSLHGEGFKAFVPVESVKLGTIEVTPSPKPNTDANGMMDFDILIPGLDVGIQTVEVKVGGTTSSTGFTVTESGINPGDIQPVAEGLEELSDNLDVIWHFNNDTKAWTFYDGQEGGTLTHVITGETYLIQVKSTVEVILNRDTRNLTCANGNCWNQIVW